jgi:hypothetical protein
MTMRKVYISTYNRSQVILLPVPPSISHSSPSNNELYKIDEGELNLPGVKGAKQLTLQGFFPVYQYPYVQSTVYTPDELVELIEGFQAKKDLLRLVVPKDNLNLPILIDGFDHEKAPIGDIQYTMKVSEFWIPGW